MAKEIERKFLVLDDSYKSAAVKVVELIQGYISTDPDCTIRVRIAGDKAFLTVKNRNRGAVRDEWEHPLSLESARRLLEHDCQKVISKQRYFVPDSAQGLMWEVDEFAGALSPLVVAEIELPSAETAFSKPAFIGLEVTDDPQYYNSNLVARV